VAQPSARRVALAALKTWRTKKGFADRVISPLLDNSVLEPSDRAFALELFYGVLRNLTLLDFWIAGLRRVRINTDLRDVLRLGIYQLLVAKIPDHAAVYETVELVPERERPIVNGVLRSAVRKREAWFDELKSQPPDVRFSHPKFLIERWNKQFGGDSAIALCEWDNQPPPTYARINQLKIDRESFLNRYRAAGAVSQVSNFAELPSPGEALERGDCYVQDPSTAIACELLGPKPNEKILDACSAPGGKTGYLAELMENRGLIVACDRDSDRLRLVDENLARLEVQIARVVHHDWTKRELPNAIRSDAPFDRILIDAPCSNTGVMRRRVDVRWRLKPADFARMATRQIEIVRATVPLLKPDGILVYSSCSLEREENEDVAEKMFQEMPMLKLEEQRRSLPFRDGLDGAFAARFRRTD
jgi:16S rRNA (cytosine967-C5)-methyltransferase